MHFDRNLTVRVNDHWIDRLDLLMNVVSRSKRFDRSTVVRQVVTRDADLWLDSPYISTASRHFIFVSASGDVYYRAVELLFLNNKRLRLPVSLEMKPEKQVFYENSYEGAGNEISRIRDHWMLNVFSVWKGDRMDGSPIAQIVDRRGITKKAADIPIHQAKDFTVVRETIVALRDYVQRKSDAGLLFEEGDIGDDRGDVAIEIPTLDLDLQIVVDLDLYGNNPSLSASAAVDYELRNRESALFQRRNFGGEENPIGWTKDRWPGGKFHGPKYESVVETIQGSFGELSARLLALTSETELVGDGRPVVENAAAREVLRSLSLPRSYLFGHLTWPIPCQGLEVCLTWNKPD